MASRLLARLRYAFARLGPLGWIGVALLVGAALVAAVGAPALDRQSAALAGRIDEARRDIAQVRDAARAPRTPDDAQQLLARLPALDLLPVFIESLQEEAVRRGLEIDRAEYRQSTGAALRLQVHLPVRGEYPALRRWLETLLQKHPSLALDDLSLRRTAEGASTVEARVSLSFYARNPR